MRDNRTAWPTPRALELRIEAAQSLKDKRQVLRSLKDRLRVCFNVSGADLEASGPWSRASIGVVASLIRETISRD
ncbi:MAG: DUF503 domain-containing protein [Candidatus Sulfotelmatobacter sp.]